MSDSDFLKIDPLALDKEWLEQPSLYFEYAERLAGARRELDAAKTQVDLIDAELSKAIRANPTLYKLEKVTEGAVSDVIKMNATHKAACEDVVEANYELNVLQAAVTALDHRKRALTMLVELHGMNYFASPSITKNPELRESAKTNTMKKAVARTAGKYSREEAHEDAD